VEFHRSPRIIMGRKPAAAYDLRHTTGGFRGDKRMNFGMTDVTKRREGMAGGAAMGTAPSRGAGGGGSRPRSWGSGPSPGSTRPRRPAPHRPGTGHNPGRGRARARPRMPTSAAPGRFGRASTRMIARPPGSGYDLRHRPGPRPGPPPGDLTDGPDADMLRSGPKGSSHGRGARDGIVSTGDRPRPDPRSRRPGKGLARPSADGRLPRPRGAIRSSAEGLCLYMLG